MSFYCVERWYMKLHTKDLNIISIAYHKVMKRNCNNRPFESYHECLERVILPIFKRLVAKKVFSFSFCLFQSKSIFIKPPVHVFVLNQTVVTKLKNSFMKNIKFLRYFINLFCVVIACIEFIQLDLTLDDYYAPLSNVEILKSMALC